MKKAEKLKLAIDAIEERLGELAHCNAGAYCLLCIRLNVKCHRCPARRTEVYSCGEYSEDLYNIVVKLRQQRDLWKTQLEKLEGKKDA